MVLASNKWLNNGDDQKPSEVVTPQTNSVAAIPNSTHKQDQLKPNFMSTTKTTEQTVAEKDSLSGGGGGGEVQPSSESAMNSNDNQNDETTDAMNRRQEIEEQHKTLENILKAMASNENNSDYVINDEVLETARTLPNSIEPTEEEELENNNHLIPTTTDIDADHRTDSNINVLKNNESTIKGSDIVNLTTLDDNVMATLTGGGVVSSNKTDRKSFLNTLTNLNTAQTVVMNNANTLSLSSSSSSSSASSSSLSNKPVNPVYALNTGGNIINSNLNPHIMNGDASVQCSATNGAQAKIVLNCEQNSHPFQTRTIFLTPNIECKVGRLIAKCKASESNAIFDCKVLSRNHAVLWYSDDGKFWVRDTKSSNGTFINEYKLGNDAAVLHYGDTVKFGVDVLENSRKEVHGCIIASVKLYLPDGRQAISSDNSSTQRSQYSGESRISFDDLHRLNVYMQETSQREKALKSKLYNIQNLLDATRKNSSTCWQAMISEDQLLHRIHSLEKKIQILEKNMPESALKNEIMKLIDDKSAYQHSAKEALRSVYLERCEAMQKLSKLESDFAASENEGQILREKISSTEEALHDASERLRLLEIESNEHRNERERQQLEAKLEFEEQIQELTEKLQQREDDCDALRIRIAEASSSSSSLQQKKKKQNRLAESHNDEDKLQKQAIENLDAVIAGMDMGDDDEEEDDDNDNDDEHVSNDEDDDDEEEDSVDEDVAAALQGKRQRHKAGDVFDFNGSHEKEEKTDKHRGGEEATIMKWLKNSDLKMKEGSMDIINAICNNESDSSDEQDAISPIAVDQDIMQRYARLEEKLNGLKYQIKHIEEDVKEYQMDKATESYDNDDYDINGESEDDDNKKGSNLQTKLKQNVSSLNEACEEIFESIQQLRGAIKQKEQVSPTSPMVTPQFQKLNTTNTTKSSVNITTLPEIDEVDDEHDSEDEEENGCYNDDKDGDVGVSRKTLTVKSVDTKDASNAIIAHLKSEIEELKMKLNERDLDSQHMMEMLQIECETHKTKVDELLKLIEEQQKILTAEQDTIKLPTVIDDLSNGDGASSDSGLFGIDKTTETTAAAAASSSQHQPVMDASINTSISGSISEIESSMVEHGAATVADFEQQMSDELITLNNSFVQREEELIAYKESLEQSQKENLQLRNDLQRLKEHQPERNAILLLLTFVPIGAVVIAVLAYLSFNYF